MPRKRKKKYGETPEQTAKRIKDEEKARLDEEAEATAELEIEAEQKVLLVTSQRLLETHKRSQKKQKQS